MSNIKIKLKKIYSDLNSIDISQLLKKLNDIKLEDIQNFKLDDLKSIHKNKSFPFLIGGLSFLLFSYLFLYPSIANLIKLNRKANLYEDHFNQIADLTIERDKLVKLIKKIETPFSSLKETILEKNQLILINRIISDVALKSDVEILSLMKINEDPFSICRALNEDEQNTLGLTYNNLDNNNNFIMTEDQNYSNEYNNDGFSNSEEANSFPQDNLPPKELNFINNYLEISLKSEYFNTIKFIRLLQSYKITIIPTCINIGASSYQGSESESSKQGYMNSKFIINIPTKEQ